jgi:hypothetical protein
LNNYLNKNLYHKKLSSYSSHSLMHSMWNKEIYKSVLLHVRTENPTY